jgi:integrase
LRLDESAFSIKRGKTWAAVVDVGRAEDGRRLQKWHSGYRTKRGAEAALVEILGQLQTGTYAAPSKQTFGTFLREWLVGLAASGLRPSTVARYRALAETHVLPSLGPRQLQDLTPAMLNRLYAQLLKDGRKDGNGGLSPRTVILVHSTIHKALATAVKQRLLQRNPADDAERPGQAHRPEMRVWTAAQLRSFLDHVRDDPLGPAITLAATTGLRRGEVLGLRWGRVDLDAGRVSIAETLVTVDYEVQASTPKTARSRRTVALDAGTVQVLHTQRARQLAQRLELGLGRPGADDYVFSQPDGSPIHPNGFSDRFDRLVSASGLPRLTVHGLRHTWASLALQAGIPAKVVADRLGHSSISVTLDTYSHLLPGLQEDAANRVADLVFGQAAG